MEFQHEFKCEQPNFMLNSFNGNLKLQGSSIVFNDKNLLIRGCRLMNTEWVVGVVVYTGENTKIMLNSKKPTNKSSQISLKLNKLVALLIIFQLSISAMGMLGSFVWLNLNYSKFKSILIVDFNINTESFLLFFTFFLLTNSMIPISLLVSIEMVKLLQCYFINVDDKLYDPER